MPINNRHQTHVEQSVDHAAKVAEFLRQLQMFGVDVFVEAVKANPSFIFGRYALLEDEIRRLAGEVWLQARQLDEMQDVVDQLTQG